MSNSIRSIHAPRRADAGFTLVEVLIAIVVLVFGLIAVTNLFLVAGSSNTVANQSTAAADVAGQILENLRAQPWNSGQLNTGIDGSTAGSLTADSPGYFRSDQIPGVGTIASRWTVLNVDVRTKFIRVRSEGTGVLSRGRSRAEFTTFRACTVPISGCP
jgi:prepilin-type N-terminal cleavage/methylation domain-containing protein